MKLDADAGFLGLKQIWKSLIERDVENKDDVFEKHTGRFLNRCFPDWMK